MYRVEIDIGRIDTEFRILLDNLPRLGTPRGPFFVC